MDQATGYDCRVIDDVRDLMALEHEWKSLHSASKDGYLSESFDWAQVCWNDLAHKGPVELCCPVVREHGRMAALLPLVVSKVGMWRLARPLASPSNEYCPLVFDASADIAGVWKAARTELGRRRIDAISLIQVRSDSAIGAWLQDCPAATWIRSLPAPFLRTAEFADWESYRSQLSSQVQNNLKRNWKRIRQLGEVTFEELTDRAEVQAAWRWMVLHKREWLVRKGKSNPYIPSDEFFRFATATLGIDGDAGRRSILALKLNGRLLAAELVNVDRRRVEMFVVTFDPAFGQYAPGNLLRSEVLRWAFAQGLDYDWRIGGDAYKADWANRSCDAHSYVLALNAKGRSYASYSVVRQGIATRTPEHLRAKVRSLLHLPAAARPVTDPGLAAEPAQHRASEQVEPTP